MAYSSKRRVELVWMVIEDKQLHTQKGTWVLLWFIFHVLQLLPMANSWYFLMNYL